MDHRSQTRGDVLTKSPEQGGLGFGTIVASAVLGVILGLASLYTTRQQNRETNATLETYQPAGP